MESMKRPKRKNVSSRTRKKSGYRIIGKNGWEDTGRDISYDEAIRTAKKIRKKGRKAIVIDNGVRVTIE